MVGVWRVLQEALWNHWSPSKTQAFGGCLASFIELPRVSGDLCHSQVEDMPLHFDLEDRQQAGCSRVALEGTRQMARFLWLTVFSAVVLVFFPLGAFRSLVLKAVFLPEARESFGGVGLELRAPEAPPRPPEAIHDMNISIWDVLGGD